MPFVADDLGAWLVALFADAGRKKLTTLVLGSQQERALREAATAAVGETAVEISQSGGEQAEHLAMVISEVFHEAIPGAGPERLTMLEGLRTGIARQLAVLDDADLTGVGRSAADFLAVSGAVLAERLAGHLVREIMLRGSRGGPLAPLGDQLNHERTQDMLARLTVDVRDMLARQGHSAAAGRLLDEVTDPFALEVHRPVQSEAPRHGLPVLPVYVPREHDAELEGVVAAAAEGESGIAVLVGGSSTGKTRACWEALRLLRDQPQHWRVWHPISPSRPEAALRELSTIGPRTVIWLNEAQFYLDVPGGVGERIAAGLRELLRDSFRRPVLVLATMWPSFWDVLTTRPDSGMEDPHAQARELLVGRGIIVSASFTAAQVALLGETRDARLVQAAQMAQDSRITQFLAGSGELLARYRQAPAGAAALLHAAMDARRLGMGPALPYTFLASAAPGYLSDSERDRLAEDWLEQALAYATVPVKGVDGPLAPILPRRDRGYVPGQRENPALLDTGRQSVPLFRLADYLDQYGRNQRMHVFPPAEFWAAAADHAPPGDQVALGSARRRSRPLPYSRPAL